MSDDIMEGARRVLERTPFLYTIATFDRHDHKDLIKHYNALRNAISFTSFSCEEPLRFRNRIHGRFNNSAEKLASCSFKAQSPLSATTRLFTI